MYSELSDTQHNTNMRWNRQSDLPCPVSSASAGTAAALPQENSSPSLRGKAAGAPMGPLILRAPPECSSVHHCHWIIPHTSSSPWVLPLPSHFCLQPTPAANILVAGNPWKMLLYSQHHFPFLALVSLYVVWHFVVGTVA